MKQAANKGGLVKVTIIALAVIILGLVNSQQSHAQTVSRQSQRTEPFAATFEHPCTGEPVSVTGRQQAFADSTMNAQGGTKAQLRTHQQGQGVSQVTLTNYQYQNMSRMMTVSSNVDHFTIQSSERTHIISTGQPSGVQDDSFFVYIKTTVVVNKGEIASFNSQLNGPSCK